MKKLLVAILFITILLSGCSNEDTESMGLEVRFLSNVEVRYSPGEFDTFWVSQTEGVYTDDAIPDRETAMTVATAVFRGMSGSEHRRHYVIASVSFDGQDDIWMVLFLDERYLDRVGGGVSIALSQSTGEVLKILFGE